MTFKIIVETFESYGYGNFFDSIREEHYRTKGYEHRTELLNRHLSEYNARIDDTTMNCVVFDTEDDANWFVLRWS